MIKKAELTSTQLVTIIILIISFAIILAFFFMLGLRGSIDKESCRNSVVMRGVLPIGKDVVSLRCKTQDVCLSLGAECDINRKDMTTIKVKDENELTKEMVNLLWDCWWMMGEGKVDYMPSRIGTNEAYCSICNKVYFDSKIQEKYKDGISYLKLYNYMKENKVPNKDESYLFSIYKMNSLDSLKESLLSSGIDIYKYSLDSEKEYVVMTGMNEQGWGKAVGGGVGGTVGVMSGLAAGAKIGAIFGSVGGPIGTVVGGVAGAGTGTVIGIWIGSKANDFQHMAPQYKEFKKEELEKGFLCKEYVSEG